MTTDKPILFSAPMARALVAGRKTETRRTLNPQPYPIVGRSGFWNASGQVGGRVCTSDRGLLNLHNKPNPGNRLWVREAWRVSNRWNGTKPRDLPARTMTVFMEAGGSIANQNVTSDWRPSSWPALGEMPEWVGCRRQAIFMPRWASRTTLVVRRVRVERLHDITEAGAQAEGVDPANFGNVARLNANLARTSFFRLSYADLWDDINGPGAWAANPWVCVISFSVILQNIDEVKP
jgi:hypothetical protein